MNILICDDEDQYLDSMKSHVKEYMSNHYIKANIIAVKSPSNIINNDIKIDLAFLDIQMPNIDGITLAKSLKARNDKIILIFVTNYDEYQDEAMDLRIFRFFKKPFEAQRLYSSLDKAMEYIDEQYIDLFLYNNGEQIRILTDDIVYIRRENRKIILTDINGKEYITRENIDSWTNKLPNSFFYQVHKSFLINLHYITKYSYTELYLNSEVRIPIASRKQADFHKYWFQYLKRR